MKKLEKSPEKYINAVGKYGGYGLKCYALKPASKQPALLGAFNKATSSPKKFAKQISSMKDLGVGIAAGAKSGAVMIDIDPRNGGDKTFENLVRRHGDLPPCPEVETGGGGRHYYLMAPSEALRKCKLGKGVDFIADGGGAVAPPSVHPSGNEYKWAPGASLDDLPLPELPKEWLDAARKAQPGTKRRAILEGERNNTLTSRAGAMVRKGITGKRLEKRLLKINATQCMPPLEDEEVRQIARSVSKYPRQETVDPPSRVVARLLDQEFGGGSLLRFERDGRWWCWGGTHWSNTTENELKAKLFSAAQAEGVSSGHVSLVNEALNLLKLCQATSDDLLHFKGAPPVMLNVRNGELWLQDKKVVLRPHDPKSGARHTLPVEYNPEAKAPEFRKALKAIFNGANDPDGLRRFIAELFGYVIQPRRNMACIVIFVGKGANGKTKLVELMMKLLGEGLVYSGRMEELDAGRFSLGALFGKYLFVDDDIKSGTKLPDGVLKKISEEKLITGEQKYRDHFEFTCRTVPMLLCNNWPAAGFVDTEIRCSTGLESWNATTEVQPRVQA